TLARPWRRLGTRRKAQRQQPRPERRRFPEHPRTSERARLRGGLVCGAIARTRRGGQRRTGPRTRGPARSDQKGRSQPALSGEATLELVREPAAVRPDDVDGDRVVEDAVTDD